MLKLLILIPVVFILAIAGLDAFLSPDDISGCDASPSETLGCRKVDAIVAVSGGKTHVRAAEAIELYQNGWADLLIFSGAAKDTSGPSNAEVMRNQAIQAGVPQAAILLDETSQTTHQNAKETSDILRRHNISEIIVVTSPYHQRRAGLEFSQITGPSVKVYNHPAPNDPDWPALWWLTPKGWWLTGGELVKITAAHAGESQ